MIGQEKMCVLALTAIAGDHVRDVRSPLRLRCVNERDECDDDPSKFT